VITPTLSAPVLLRAPADCAGDSVTLGSAPSSPAYQSAIDHLAALAGVEPSYYDVSGQHHIASTSAKAAVLQALGVTVDTLADVQAATAAWQARQAAEVVGPVVVLRRQSDNQGSWLLPLANDALTAPLSWTITTEDGQTHQGQTVATRAGSLVGLPLAVALPDGYHALSLCSADGAISEDSRLIVAPARCWVPGSADGTTPRLWGVGAQLYSLRSERNWGMGDLADLRSLCQMTGNAGGAVVGLNPIHALFLPKPQDASPYSPNSRLFLNPLYIALDAVPEYADCPAAQKRLQDPAIAKALSVAQQADHVDYPAVATVKLAVLRDLFARFAALPADHARQQAFRAFVQTGGERLRLFAIFQTLQDRFGSDPWPCWPEDYHSPHSPQVAAVAEQQAEAVQFQLWLQFETDRQLADAAEALRVAGGSLGLYRDLAVGASPDGADVWMDPAAYVRGARFGAPPDALGPLGQDWGLPPFNPVALRAMGYGPFIDMVRANMRHAGALRIDHAMSLLRLFWIPPGLTARDGLYVSYPFDDLLGVLALESHRARCVIIGEDLGTVPAGFRERMAEENLLSYRLSYFERYESGLFKRPDTYPPLALATPTSHDLATIVGHWRGWDIALRHDLGLCGDTPNRAADEARRQEDRHLLQSALVDQGLIPADFPQEPTGNPAQEAELIAAFHRFLARSPALVMLANLDDLCGEVTQVNVPGTVSEYPNWRRRLTVSLNGLADSALFRQTVAAISAER